MVLKPKNKMTNKELCDLEGLIFPALMEAVNENKSQKEAFGKMIERKGKEIVKLCYTDEDGLAFNKVEFPFRMKLLTDAPIILSLIFGEDAIIKEGDGKKPEVMKITRP